MKTLLEYLRLFLYRWFGYDPKPQPFWKIKSMTLTTKDGQTIQSSCYTDKTIYERFEQPVQMRADNVETLPRP